VRNVDACQATDVGGRPTPVAQAYSMARCSTSQQEPHVHVHEVLERSFASRTAKHALGLMSTSALTSKSLGTTTFTRSDGASCVWPDRQRVRRCTSLETCSSQRGAWMHAIVLSEDACPALHADCAGSKCLRPDVCSDRREA